jgi:hypothetical protein
MFPQSLFPKALFPQAMFPGPGKAPATSTGTPIKKWIPRLRSLKRPRR